jgi:hypothetical protein
MEAAGYSETLVTIYEVMLCHIETAGFSEKLETFYQTTCLRISEDSDFHERIGI